MRTFQGLGEAVSAPSFWSPEYVQQSAWIEHGPFAFWLVDALRPRTIVELGTHWGFSYFSFCQAVARLDLPARCFAVDSWQGDEHAGFYGEDVFKFVNNYNDDHYASFSSLIRSKFDDALSRFEDKSIDLLHIDGRHYYDDVKHDFESWRRKLSDRSVVVFHDTNVRERDFGVFKLWAELVQDFPHFEFHHGHGLGILGFGKDLPERVRHLMAQDDLLANATRSAYARLGAAVAREQELARLEETLANVQIQREGDIAELRMRLTQREAETSELRMRLTRREAETSELRVALSEREVELARAEAKLAEREAELAQSIEQGAEDESAALHSSRAPLGVRLKAAWRHPTNPLKRKAFRATHGLGGKDGTTVRRRSRFFTNVRAILLFPLSPDRRRAWRESKGAQSFDADRSNNNRNLPIDARLYKAYKDNSLGHHPASDYVARSGAVPAASREGVKVVAYYLPQFHPIPENDEWWGKGFTEWRNVARAFPAFDGHYQPRVPGELGYYDLRIIDNMRRQVELARQYGVSAFCFHFYWFGGKRLLELPLLNFLENKDLDLQFSLCWANENWSRRWDGGNNELLLAQQHSPEDDVAFIRYLEKYFRDERYLKVDGKPVLTVYRPEVMPFVKETLARWRGEALRMGFNGLYLIATNAFNFADYQEYGFDALSEFPPNHGKRVRLNERLQFASGSAGTTVFSYPAFVESEMSRPATEGIVHPGVMPGWDNSARRPHDAQVFHGATPALFRQWLGGAIERAAAHPADQRFVFINAWNEWAEGTHLEPDARYGYAWLQAVRDSLAGKGDRSAGGKRIVLVSHDAHPHGAQMLALHFARTLRDLGVVTDLIVLGPGVLMRRFEEVATVQRVDLALESEAQVLDRLRRLRLDGAEAAIVNTAVSGSLVPLLKMAGFRTVSLIHELPGLLKSYKLDKHARSICEHADKVVFPAQIVRRGFEEFAGRKLTDPVIRPQGLYLRNGPQGESSEARRRARANLCLQPDARLILCVGYGDHRKGLDLFIETCMKVLQTDAQATAVWVGNTDRKLIDPKIPAITAAGLLDRFIFTGLVQGPQDFYAAADVFALTSREDPFPSVVLEALDAGIPVVAFKGAGGFEDLLSRDCGLLVQAFDTSEMARAIGTLLDDSTLATKLGRTGKAIVDQEFDFIDYVHDVLALAEAPPPKVSVIVPNYNYARYLSDRLTSIAEQTVVPIELIVLDDASTDESVDKIRKFLLGCAIPSTFIVNEQNSGSVFRQWQRGVEMATGDFVWIAEADDFADPDFLAELLPAFTRPDVVMSFCQSRQMDGQGKILCENYLDYVGDIDRERWTRPYVAEGHEEIAKALHVKNTIPNVSAVLFRRDALQTVLTDHGDEIMSFRHAGDWVAYLRLLEHGGIAYSPRSLNSHRRHKNSVTIGNFNFGQLQEIVRVQRETIDRHALGVEARRAADRYAQQLYEQFGLVSQQHPYFGVHPALQPEQA